MVLGVGQLREIRPYMAPGNLAVLGDDVSPFFDWDLARVEDRFVSPLKIKDRPFHSNL